MPETKKPFVDLIVVIPIGPKCRAEFIADTLSSLQFYTTCNYKIILADDSQAGTGLAVKNKFPQVEVITTPRNFGKLCGLYLTLSLAYRHAISYYHFGALLRMDTDALIIGNNPEREAISIFKKYPHIGIAGQYPNDYYGKPWDTSWPHDRIIKSTRTWKLLRKPLANLVLRWYYLKALRNGYVTGESVFGGAYFISEACLLRLKKKGLLPLYLLGIVNLEEDHLFSLLIKAIGFDFGDLATDKMPVGCAWKGLPASPQQLYENGKKIIHSTRYWQNMGEEEIRNYFKNQREAQTILN